MSKELPDDDEPEDNDDVAPDPYDYDQRRGFYLPGLELKKAPLLEGNMMWASPAPDEHQDEKE